MFQVNNKDQNQLTGFYMRAILAFNGLNKLINCSEIIKYPKIWKTRLLLQGMQLFSCSSKRFRLSGISFRLSGISYCWGVLVSKYYGVQI